MNASFSIRDSVTPEMQRDIRSMQNPRPLMAALGKTLEQELIRQFREFDSSRPNKQGWPRRHFWNRRVAQKTALTAVEASRAVVTVASPEYLHKIHGGTVTAKRSKTLAIPANAEMYKFDGPRASGQDYNFLLLAQGNLVGALLRPMSQKLTFGKKGVKAGAEQGGEVMWWLVRSVEHAPDPSVDPETDPTFRNRIVGALQRALAIHLPRLLRKQG